VLPYPPRGRKQISIRIKAREKHRPVHRVKGDIRHWHGVPSLISMPANNWTDWQPLPLTLTTPVLAELLDGGQSFRWRTQGDGEWIGTWSDCTVKLIRVDDGELQWSAPTAAASRVQRELAVYFGLNNGLAEQVDTLPWRSDAHLAKCLKTFPGLRILRQPFGETLLCFLCSATKQIVQIKQMTELLAGRHGREISPGFSRLPTWSELAFVSEIALRRCQLGFRARLIHETAKFLAAHPGWLAETEALPYAEAKERLCLLPGVGEKIADCTLLFGAGRLEAFPVDVWILRTMERRYGLAGWKPAQVTQFGRAHFGPLAGLAQQYLFAYERHAAKGSIV
jgi:N-glycosylase/DNA lyase